MDVYATTLAIVGIVVVIVLVLHWRRTRPPISDVRRSQSSARPPNANTDERRKDGGSPTTQPPEEDSVCEQQPADTGLRRLSYTEEADPLITGQLYSSADYMRPFYAQRTVLDKKQGLVEFSSSGSTGDVGVDVPPLDLDAPSPSDDGIPENWALPSTPIQWYRPRQRDYYGQGGPTVYAKGLYQLSEPDHDPPQ